jgi:DNA ligase-1
MTIVFDKNGRLPTLYTKTAAGKIVTWQCSVEGNHVVVVWGEEGGAQQTARFECKPKNAGRSNETTAEQQARAEAAAKWTKQIKRKYAQNKSDLDSVKVKPMLAKEYHDQSARVQWPVMTQVKLDGLRCLAYFRDGKVVLQSRGGEFFDIPRIAEHIQTTWKREDYVLDGELYSHGMPLQNIVSAVRVFDPDKTPRIEYVVYDCFNPCRPDEPFSSRIGRVKYKLYDFRLAKNPNISKLESRVCQSQKELDSMLTASESHGFEGVMVRDPDSSYRAGYRSPGLLKLKSFSEDEYKIVGYSRGKGKMADCVIFECVTADGGTFNVVPTGTMSERREMLRNAKSHVGKWLTVRYWGTTNDHKPKFPQGVLIRGKRAL